MNLQVSETGVYLQVMAFLQGTMMFSTVKFLGVQYFQINPCFGSFESKIGRPDFWLILVGFQIFDGVL
jgi:hypothetical protein